MVTGSDAVYNGWGLNMRELDWFVKMGMTPAQALKTATTEPAAMLEWTRASAPWRPVSSPTSSRFKVTHLLTSPRCRTGQCPLGHESRSGGRRQDEIELRAPWRRNQICEMAS